MSAPAIVFRVSEALDAELIRQKRGGRVDRILDLDGELLSVAVLKAASDFLTAKGQVHAARAILSELER